MINNVWGKYLDLQAVVAEKEDTISQMYAKISHMQQADAAAAAKSSNSLTSISHPV